MDELVEFLALAFIQITDHADLTTVFLDDFHWVDAFSWRIFRVLCKKAKKLILLSATRSHDKQALRRMSTAVAQESQLQSQMIEISLGPLDFAEIRELMAAVLDHKKSAIPDALCTDVFQRTGGLPVYVVQVLENIKRKKTLELVDGVLKWTAEGLLEKVRIAIDLHGTLLLETHKVVP
jgi:predicted ATPase